MENEKLKILKMLEEGKINSEEASKLISSVDINKNSIKKPSSSNSSNNKSNSNIDFSNLLGKVENVTSNLFKKGKVIVDKLEHKVKDIAKNTSNSINSRNLQFKEFNFTLSSLDNILNLKSLNGEMTLKGYNGDKLTLKIKYQANNSNERIEFYNSGDNIFLLEYDSNNFKKVILEALIPIKYFKNIIISSVNSNYLIDNIKAKDISCEAINSNGIIQNLDTELFNLNSKDGKIIFKNSSILNSNIYNINGYTKVKNVDIKDFKIENLNGLIEITNDYLNNYSEYNWILDTQNMPIEVEINTDTINYNINAISTLGNIEINKNNLLYTENSLSKVIAYTENVNHNFKNMNINMSTTNSRILLN